MKKILFVCHGNICRSPMAEFVMKELVKKAGLASEFHIESAATSREEIGNPVYPPARRKLAEHGISCDGHAARQLTNADYENYDLLKQYPVEELFGGKAQALGGNVYHVCRGSVLELEGKKYLCFGGAESPDKEDREPGVNWWKEELPSDEEYAACEANLAACDYKVDYVLTHDAPSRFLDFTALACGETNQLHSFLDKILLKLTYEKWFFGCYHKDVQLSTKSRCVFCEIIPMK